MLGVQNVNRPTACTEVWFNELRLTDISDQGGWAAVGKVDVKLADLGTLNVSASEKTAGFGSIDQSTNQRSFDNNGQMDAAVNLEMGKLLPKKAAVSVPLYAGVTRTVSTPEYDPFDLDIKLADKIKMAPAKQKDSIKDQAVDAATITTVNFTNVHKNNVGNKKLKIWSVENLNVSYSYSRSEHHSPLAVEDENIVHKAILAYNYTHVAKFWEPFKKKIKSKSLWLSLIKDFNINPMPSVLGFQANVNRQFGAYRSRNIGGPQNILPETFNKFFTFDRTYTLRWDLTRSIALDYTAANHAWVDEDSGRLDKEGRQKMWHNFWKGGRNILYTQTANATYTLPTSKIPALDWTTVRAGYSATYTWTGASQLAVTQGNNIQNTQQRTVLAELDFTRLYSKWKLLRGLDQAPRPAANGKNGQDTSRNAKRPLPAQPVSTLTGVPKALVKILTSLKHITLNYSDNSSSTIYGYMDSTQALGMDFHTKQPGWKYVLGSRPDTNFINKLGQRGLLSTDTTFNNQNLISYTQKISAVATLEPFRDLHININLDKTFGMNYSELYKDTVGGAGPCAAEPLYVGYFQYQLYFPADIIRQISAESDLRDLPEIREQQGDHLQSIGGSQSLCERPGGGGWICARVWQVFAGCPDPAFVAAYTVRTPARSPLSMRAGVG